MKRIGIFGGTFNPIHTGHLFAAQMAQEILKLNKVIFVPSNLPPHKVGKNVIPSSFRYEMVRLAIEDNSSFEVSDFESKKNGKSYSIDTVRYLCNQLPRGTKIFFIIGRDGLATLHKWKQVNEILKLATFVAINRPGYGRIKERIKARTIGIPGLEISSSQLRQRIAKGRTVKYLLPERVIQYIEKQGLYKGNRH
ncbi:MAG TPA: nicotinic acid mononucleotide adenylyltransferase [Candidatus Omnitrophica bacterium]|nr:MAG: nicotinate (nicotinamide) nucleotide adenylyltransferase [Omnitrophica WOR_2 bacterium GWA2_45_18]OGX19695.1 MAG: nicotinate (nicotinamide) nucleotide adenylyltransferase [Omnitrophica WOR_2 bacterium GWC2_45_7]HBR14617.1 nicotinic acid mononucleotide adenylyltransferase [Candidatus Omnitrophota bacterium]